MPRAGRVAALACAGLLGVLAVLALRAGTTVLGLTLVLEALGLAALGLAGRLPRRLRADERLLRSRAPSGADGLSARLALTLVAVLTVVGLALRLVGLGSDLWLDEIVTVREYAQLPIADILRTYGAANNHLLASILIHLSTAALGLDEWAIRLPSLVAGVLAIPATYWLARRTQTRLPALCVAAIVAVAYQHVFFSQSARGYALQLLFALLATGLLVEALRLDLLWSWAGWVVTAVLCVVAVPTGAFVVAGQALVVAALLAVAVGRGRRVAAAAARAAVGFAVVGVLTAQAYAGVIGKAAGVAQGAWQGEEAGFEPLSRDFLEEVGRSAGIGTSPAVSVLALVAAAAGVVGLVSLLRRDAALLALLVLGPALHLLYAAVEGLAFSPRFLVLWLFPAALVGVETLVVLGRALGSPRRATVVVLAGTLALSLAVASPFRHFLGVPKQRYREAIAHAERLRGDGLVVAIYTAESGLRWYGVERPDGPPLEEGKSLAVARTADRLVQVERAAGGRPLVLLTTFERGLAAGRPRLDAAVRTGWRPDRVFDGAIDGGEITVWVPREPLTP